jgi:hypothetical protein
MKKCLQLDEHCTKAISWQLAALMLTEFYNISYYCKNN